MKKICYTAFLVTSTVWGDLLAQGTFQNLDFESARVTLTTNQVLNEVAVSEALPGWSASVGTNQLATVEVLPDFSFSYLFPGPVDLIASRTGSIDGDFSVFLQTSGLAVPSEHGTISQIGRVAAGVHSLLFKATIVPGSSLQVSLGGASLSFFPLSTQPDYTLYGADISAFAGQTANLVFMSTTWGGRAEIDDIEFSPQIVPEPSVLALTALGFAALLVFRQKGRRQGEQAGSPINHAETKWSPSSGSGSCVR